MDKQLKARLKTAAEIKLLDMDISEILTELLLDYGEKKIRMEAAKTGLSELLIEDINKIRPGEKGRK